ncbi:MAG: hypothetical protein J7L11_10730 [Thermoprotei archaeon]|nr:hypothetical protein [Thermoprotei archaeon]
MLVYLAPCGIGLGHAARCIAIAKELRRRGTDVVFSTYGEAVQFVRKAGFHAIKVPGIEYRQKADGTIDLQLTLAKGPSTIYWFLRQVGAEIYNIGQYKPDIVISDTRLSSVIASAFRITPRILLINQLLIVIPRLKPASRKVLEVKNLFERLSLEFLSRLWSLSNLILIPDFPPPLTISKANLVVKREYADRSMFIGPLIPRRPEELPSREELRKKLGVDDKILVFIALSGTLYEKISLALSLLRIVKRIKGDFLFVISVGMPGGSGVYSVGDNVLFFEWLEDRYEFLKAADVLVSHGGHTTIAEAMYYGIPMILIPTRGHTERIGNARSVEKLGIAEVIPQEKLSLEIFTEKLKIITGNGEYLERCKEVKHIASFFNAANKAADIILSLVNNEEL